jgi:ParB family chromosome partitioning protein
MSKQKKFNLDDNFKKMFSSTTLNNQNILSGITNIAIEKLIPFKNHPFKLYEGERFTDMVESIKLNGIIMPVIVRPLNEETYEILSGHNRVEAGKSAGLETIPVVIHDSLSEEEALLIVTETNLIQRSFADLSHSERAAALTVHHEAMKNQGKRTDLINEMEKLLKTIENSSNSAENSTSAQIEQKLSSREKTANIYGLNRNTVARYIRIYNNLSKDFNDILDSGKLPFIAAVELSYIPDSDQNNLSNILKQNPELKVDIKKAELLREFSNNEELTPKIIEDILLGIAIKNKNRASLPVQSIRIKGKILSKYFKPENKPEEIEAELITALEFYRAHLNTDE